MTKEDSERRPRRNAVTFDIYVRVCVGGVYLTLTTERQVHRFTSHWNVDEKKKKVERYEE